MKKLLLSLFFTGVMLFCANAMSYGDYAVICENGKYGITFFDTVCVYPQYDSLYIVRREYKEGVAGAYMSGGKWGVLVNGNRTSEPKFDAVGGDMSMNLIVSYRSTVLLEKGSLSCFYVLPVQVGGKWGYVDASGNYIIEPQYDKVSCFKKRFFNKGTAYCALVEKNGGWYIIDLLGTVLSEDLRAKLDIDNYKKRRKNMDNAEKKAVKGAFKTHGEELAAEVKRLHEVYESSKATLPVTAGATLKAEQSGAKWRLTGTDGRQLSAVLYDDVAEPEGGVVRVVKDGRYGLVDAVRGEIVPCRYDYITEFDADGFAEVWNRGFTGRVSRHGHVDLEENLLKNAENVVYLAKDVTPIQKLIEYWPESVPGYLWLGEFCYRGNRYSESYQAYDMAFALAKEQGKEKLTASSQTLRNISYNRAHGVVYEQEPSFLELMGQLVGKTMEIRNSIREIKHGSAATSASQSGVLPSGGALSGVSGGGSYQSQYQRWENLAERHYNSITNTGGSATVNGEHSGKAGSMSPSNYAQQKKAFRQAQREMARIRAKAAQAGVNIPQSKWETATISL